MISTTVIVWCLLATAVKAQQRFGFSQATFVAVESVQFYEVEVEFLSGSLNEPITFDLEVILGTASSNDVSAFLILGGEVPANSVEPVPVTFLLRLDGVAQEVDETCQFRINVTNLDLSDFGVEFSDTMDITILDSDVIGFTLTEEDYSVAEMPNAMMPVRIAKSSGVRLANPVTFRVSPLTVNQALDQDIISEFMDEDPFSPNRANEDDFDGTVLTITSLLMKMNHHPSLVCQHPYLL